MTETEYAFNPFAPGYPDDPYPHLEELRRRAPVHRHPLGFWILSRYPDVSALLRSKQSVEERNAGASPLRDLLESVQGDYSRRASGLSMLDRDPPDHTRLRRLVSQAFNPRTVESLAPRVTELVDESLDRIADAGQADLVTELAFPLPFTVISEMLGMPDTDHDRIRELAGLLARSVEPIVDEELLRAITKADDELVALVGDVVAWKRNNPADDLLTALITAEEGGDVLDDDELVGQVVLLYVAGHETTVNLVAGGVLALLRNPEQLALLRARPDLDAAAVEELLRYDSPVQLSRRIMLSPYEVGGREIPTGAFVLASLASANRDPEFWGEDAAALRLERTGARQHVSFGGGPHHCLGAALARLEGRLAIGRLVRRFPHLRLDGDVAWNGRLNLRGPQRLPISVG